MNRRALYFLGGILLLIIITAIFIIFVRSKTQQTISSNPPQQQQNQQTAGTSPGLAQNSDQTGQPANQNSQGQSSNPGSPSLVVSGPLISPILSYDSKMIWYFSPDGHLYNQTLSSFLKTEYALPSQLSVIKVIWPTVGNDFIVEDQDSTGIRYNYYDSQAKKYVAYPPNIVSVDFLPDGRHVVYTYAESNGTLSLSSANFDLSAHQTLMVLPENDDQIKAAPVGSKVFAWSGGSPANGKLYMINLDTKKLVTIKTAASNRAIWSPDGQKFIFTKLGSDADAKSQQLFLGDLVTATDKPLGFVTSTDKLAFDATGRNFVAAIPSADNTGDSFWKISTDTISKKQFYPGGTGIDALNLLVANDDSAVYFLNNRDGNVYSIPVGN